MTMIAERSGGSEFIGQVAEHPAFSGAKSHLERASRAFAECTAQMGAWWKIVGEIWSDEEAQIKATADPEIRHKFIAHIEQSRNKDREAVEHIERALEKIGR